MVAAVDGAAELGVLAIPDIVAVEMYDTAPWVIKSTAKGVDASLTPLDENIDDTLAKFRGLYDRFAIRNNGRYVKKIDDMYAEMWRDGRMNDAVRTWRRVKGKHAKTGASRPTIETNNVDFLILSTAAHQAALGISVELLTFDYDFVAFVDAIRERFGVNVVDCGRMGRTG